MDYWEFYGYYLKKIGVIRCRKKYFEFQKIVLTRYFLNAIIPTCKGAVRFISLRL